MTSADSHGHASEGSTKDLHQLVRSQMQTLPLDGCDEQQKQALSFLRKIPVDDRYLQLHAQPSAESMPILSLPLRSPSTRLQGDLSQDHFDLGDQKENLSQKLFGDDPNFHVLSQPLRQKIPLGAQRCVLGRLSIHHFPIGVISIALTQTLAMGNNTKDHEEDWSYVFDFCLYPPSWIANRAVTLSLTASSTFGHAPSISWSLKQAYYNSNPSLVDCLQSADIPGLRRLFAEGAARPSDQIAPWGNSLLHVLHPLYVKYASDG